MPRKTETQMPPPSNDRICCFCGLGDDNELDYGKFYKCDGIVTHYYCLLLSSNMQQNGKDDEGILGFLPDDINKELKRGKRLNCTYCRKSGATLGCCNTKCKKVFHFPCGLKAGSLHQFFGEFRSYCKNHRLKQKIDDQVSEELKNCENMVCYICYDDVSPRDMYDTLWAPCCKKNAWFHRTCVQRLAMSAGYFFKCPLCNNKKGFQRAMLNHGIFIPRQDASWELVPNAFEELLYRHNRCDAEICLCPKGREHTSSNAKWELTLCRTCGSQGIHMACGQIKWTKRVWECSECISILKKSLSSDSESSSIAPDMERTEGPRRNDDRSQIDDETSDSEISVGTETTGASTSESASVKTRDDEGQKTPEEEPVAMRITRRSVIPIPRSPINTKSRTPPVATKRENLSPELKRPRFSIPMVKRDSRDAIESDDDIVVISGPSRNDNSSTDRRKSPASGHAVDNSRSPNQSDRSQEKRETREAQEPKQPVISSTRSCDIPSMPQLADFARPSSEIDRRVVEIDLSESECAIPTIPSENSAVEGITAATSDENSPEFKFVITNVTSLAPEAFDNVQEESIDLKKESMKSPSRTSMFDESNGGLTPQNPIVIDDEPVSVASNGTETDNNTMHFSSIAGREPVKIVRFDSTTSDRDGNPTNTVFYGIAIPGGNHALPLLVPVENLNSTFATNFNVEKSIAGYDDRKAGNEKYSSGPENYGAIVSSTNNTAGSNATRKSERHLVASTTSPLRLVADSVAPRPTGGISSPMGTANNEVTSRTTEIRRFEVPIAPESSLSTSVPLKAIVNEIFPTDRPFRKSMDNSNNKIVVDDDEPSLVGMNGATIATMSGSSLLTKSPCGQSHLITSNVVGPLNNTVSANCDGDAGSGLDVQPAIVNNQPSPKPCRNRHATSNDDRRAARLEARRSSTHQQASDAESDSDTDDATGHCTSSNRFDASDRTGLIHKSINVRDLRFSMCGSDIVKMTVYETYTVNMKLNSSNSSINTKYRPVETTTATSFVRQSEDRDVPRSDSKDLSHSMDFPSVAIGRDDNVISNQFESTSPDVDSPFASVNRTSDSASIDIASRGQDELKENLDPIPISTNLSQNVAVAGDRKNKLRPRSGFNRSMRFSNVGTEETEGQRTICGSNDTPTKVAPREFKTVQTDSKALSNGFNVSALNEDPNVSMMMLDRSVETVSTRSMPRNFGNDNGTAEDPNGINVFKRKLIFDGDEDPDPMDDLLASTTAKRSRDRDFANVDCLVNGVMNSKREWSSSRNVSRSKKFHVNSTIEDRVKCTREKPLKCRVSIDLKRIRSVLAMNFNISEKTVNTKLKRGRVAPVPNRNDRRHVDHSKSEATLFKSRSFDDLKFDRSEVSNVALRKSKSLDDLRSLSSRSSVGNSVENGSRSGKRKRRGFEKHDCVR